MVVGLQRFREFFAPHADGYVLIGGVACHEWLAQEGLPFRVTKDLDIVLIVEALNPDFIAAFQRFIDEGDYSTRQRSNGSPELYRFLKPQREDFPFMLELSSRKPDGINLADDQRIAPLDAGEIATSLSAVLFRDDYYALALEHREIRDGLPLATINALIPLKAYAWLSLTGRKNKENRSTKRTSTSIARMFFGWPRRCLEMRVWDSLRPSRRICGAFWPPSS